MRIHSRHLNGHRIMCLARTHGWMAKDAVLWYTRLVPLSLISAATIEYTSHTWRVLDRPLFQEYTCLCLWALEYSKDNNKLEGQNTYMVAMRDENQKAIKKKNSSNRVGICGRQHIAALYCSNFWWSGYRCDGCNWLDERGNSLWWSYYMK